MADSLPRSDYSKRTLWAPGTLTNLVTLTPSKSVVDDGLKAGPGINHYSGRVVDEILDEIFAERRGLFPETSSACKLSEELPPIAEPHVDKRLKYWRDVLKKRQELQQRLQEKTGKSPDQILFNRRSTVDNRNKETMQRILDYAERLNPMKLSAKLAHPDGLKPKIDPCTCECTDGVLETMPRAELKGYKDVEIIGVPSVVQKELLGQEEALQEQGWMQSRVLDERIDKRFGDIRNVLEYFPDLDALQVTGTNVKKLQSQPKTQLIGEDLLMELSTSNPAVCSEMDESCLEPYSVGLEAEVESEAPIPEVGLTVNGKQYIVCDTPFAECCEILTHFKCDPYQRRRKTVLELTNIGRQTLSFSWQQGVYFYNRATLLLAMDNEFVFDTESFRLTHGESYKLVIMYQPRKVSMAVELWRLQVTPRVFCGNHESIQLRFHGRCTAPKEYMARLKELRCALVRKSNADEINKLLDHHARLVPLIEPPPACCPYERNLDERELFNSLNPGYNLVRFDDLEVFKGMHKTLKKPREPQWDLRLQTIKALIMRIEDIEQRKIAFAQFMVVLGPLMGSGTKLEISTQVDAQKQRTRFIYVRGVICNAIEEWEDLMCVTGESFYKSELQYYYIKQMADGEEEGEEEDVLFGGKNIPQKVKVTGTDQTVGEEGEEEEFVQDPERVAVLKSLKHSKYFRDALYMQTYSHLCTTAEIVVSVIESTEDIPN
ncbi:hypothetical protein KR222_007261 [Zaprionus bogoriensis]|nr:hypothetical protein KR222_007261 [Zaprionus bogoriensis]